MIELFIALGAGLISFLSPCVLPLIPGYISFISGQSLNELVERKKIHNINLPAKNITNCTFGGTNNSELFITSAIKGLNKSDIKKYNLSGSLFKVKTNCKGVISKSFSMSV